MSFCHQITDVAFSHLAGIHTLNMTWCDQSSITDVAFSHLAGIHTLNMSDCRRRLLPPSRHSHTEYELVRPIQYHRRDNVLSWRCASINSMNKNKKYVLQKCRKILLCWTADTHTIFHVFASSWNFIFPKLSLMGCFIKLSPDTIMGRNFILKPNP